MPAASRVGDSLSTGHICAATTTIASANTDGTVHANSIDIIVVSITIRSLIMSRSINMFLVALVVFLVVLVVLLFDSSIDFSAVFVVFFGSIDFLVALMIFQSS